MFANLEGLSREFTGVRNLEKKIEIWELSEQQCTANGSLQSAQILNGDTKRFNVVDVNSWSVKKTYVYQTLIVYVRVTIILSDSTPNN